MVARIYFNATRDDQVAHLYVFNVGLPLLCACDKPQMPSALEALPPRQRAFSVMSGFAERFGGSSVPDRRNYIRGGAERKAAS